MCQCGSNEPQQKQALGNLAHTDERLPNSEVFDEDVKSDTSLGGNN